MAQRQPQLNQLNPAAFYSEMAGEYHQPRHRRFYSSVAAGLLARVPRGIKPRTILEVGAGTGFATRLIRERFPEARVTALEPAPEMLQRGRAEVPGADWVCGSLSDFDGRGFDLVLASMAYHWLDAPEREKLLGLAAGGALALAVPVSGAGVAGGRSGGKQEGGPGVSIKGGNNGSFDGNRALEKTLRRFGGAGNWPRAARHRNELAGLLEARFSEFRTSVCRLSEDYKDWPELAASLYARGVFYALFDGRSPAAMAELISIGHEGGTGKSVFNWDICLLIARNR